MNSVKFLSMLFMIVLFVSVVFGEVPLMRQDTQVDNPFSGKAGFGHAGGNPFGGSGKPLNVSQMTPKQILDYYGLGNAIPFFTDMLDNADHMFKFATRDQHFTMVNRITTALKDSFMATIKLVQKAPVPLPHVIDKDMIDQVVEVWEQQFHDILQKDPDVDLGQIEPFFRTYADHFYLALRNGYKQLFDMGISLTWPIVFMFTPYLEKLDTEFLDREMFKDVLDAPDHLKQFLYDTLAEIMTSDYAHFVQMAATLLSNIDLKKLMNQKTEL